MTVANGSDQMLLAFGWRRTIGDRQEFSGQGLAALNGFRVLQDKLVNDLVDDPDGLSCARRV